MNFSEYFTYVRQLLTIQHPRASYHDAHATLFETKNKEEPRMQSKSCYLCLVCIVGVT